jgi:ParB family chromosome partitioning protein
MAPAKSPSQQQTTNQTVGAIVPKGELIHLKVDQIKPSANNPRRLFDPAPLNELKESIKAHGVLVPLTVYKLAGQNKYSIVDGERRYRCCVELIKEGINVQIPANIVETPDKMASLIYMFNIHAFREQWELMPTALSLREVIRELNTEDTKELHEITGLSFPQIERCKIILSFPKEFQDLSLEEDPAERIPSNFWIELYPVLEKTKELLPDLYPKPGRKGITWALVEKYRAKKIKSVIHFRRVMEAIDTAEDDDQRKLVSDTLREYISKPELETRNTFDPFIQDARKIQRAVGICERFISDMEKAKIDYAIDGKEEIIEKLNQVIEFSQRTLDKLQGSEPPEEAQ